jgi:hypothetical protein
MSEFIKFLYNSQHLGFSWRLLLEEKAEDLSCKIGINPFGQEFIHRYKTKDMKERKRSQ